jgi:hypothetical protein
MGKLLPTYKKALIDEMKDNMLSGSSDYYAFAADPVSSLTVPTLANDDYDTNYPVWSMLFGKRLTYNDVTLVIDNKQWEYGKVFDEYDNTSDTLHSNSNFYTVCIPGIVGGNYLIYKCIDNANGAPSTIDPSTIGDPQGKLSFQTSDGYVWRYVYSVSSANYDKFATDDYIPVYTDQNIYATASSYSGVEVVVITNPGSGYDAHHDGIVEAVINSTMIQISSNASSFNEYYTKNGIYIYNTLETTSQLTYVKQYISNTTGNFVRVQDEGINTDNIIEGETQYKISPRVVFNTDADLGARPKAYTTINPYQNSIGSIIMLDIGTGITRANVSIQSNTLWGSGATAYAIVPPPGGHGSDPASELDAKGFCVAFRFSNNELTTIPDNINYSKIGLMKNPYAMDINFEKSENRYQTNTFNQLLKFDINNIYYTFNVEDVIYGESSGAKGIIAFVNSSAMYVAGDRSFEDGERITYEDGTPTLNITISAEGAIYTKDVRPLYVQNINTVERSNTQTESFKLIVEF